MHWSLVKDSGIKEKRKMFTFLENLESGILRSLVFKSSYRKTMKVRTLITIVTDSTGRKKKQKADQNKNYSGNLNLEN